MEEYTVWIWLGILAVVVFGLILIIVSYIRRNRNSPTDQLIAGGWAMMEKSIEKERTKTANHRNATLTAETKNITTRKDNSIAVNKSKTAVTDALDAEKIIEEKEQAVLLARLEKMKVEQELFKVCLSLKSEAWKRRLVFALVSVIVVVLMSGAGYCIYRSMVS